MSGRDRHWFKRSTGKKRPVTRDDDDDNNNNNIIIIIIITTRQQLHWALETYFGKC